MSLSYRPSTSPRASKELWSLTGTFFCDNTTAQSLPLMPTDMMFAAVIALKAYSKQDQHAASRRRG
jgi:hypothetical protein